MSDKPANGPAFPYETEEMTYPGMMLRDYFAAQALPGLLVRAWGDPTTGVLPSNIHAHWAAAAYATADAMLKERSK